MVAVSACAPPAAAAIATPAPAAATSRASRLAGCSIHRCNHRPRVIRLQDRAGALPRPRSAERAPLAHPHTMSVAAPAYGQLAQVPLPPDHRLERKIGAVQDLATGRAQHAADVVAVHVVAA